jgi:hypothetical protein
MAFTTLGKRRATILLIASLELSAAPGPCGQMLEVRRALARDTIDLPVIALLAKASARMTALLQHTLASQQETKLKQTPNLCWIPALVPENVPWRVIERLNIRYFRTSEELFVLVRWC